MCIIEDNISSCFLGLKFLNKFRCTGYRTPGTCLNISAYAISFHDSPIMREEYDNLGVLVVYDITGVSK